MTYIIAELGVNHNGNLATAERMIRKAKLCGADAVKFQAFCATELEPPGERRDMLKKLEFGEEEFKELKKEAEKAGIDFICTPFAPHWAEFLADIGCEQIKISSGGLQDEELLKAVAGTGCDVILSTGMANMYDIWVALRVMGWPENVTLLHCTSAYPAPVEDVNLKAMETMRETFHLPVGLSDHTLSYAVPVAATALGATIIERHFTLDTEQDGPDHSMSTPPEMFGDMVAMIRHAEKALGNGIKIARPSEDPVKKIVDERLAWANDPVEAYKNASQGE